MKRKNYLIALARPTLALLTCGLPGLAGAAPGALDVTLSTRLVVDVPVSGRVVGSDGAGLPGVTVLVRGTSNGTSTNADGTYSLNVPEGSTLVFSYVGFKTQEVAVGSTGTINVTLAVDEQKLSEVVVVGYGTQERGSITGAVSSVNSAELIRQPTADVSQAIQGKVSGVTITSNGGAPGGAAGTSIRIRGITSAGNNNPLYVVDGFPLPDRGDSQLNAISPNDIESVDILKDASATAIYGVRAANGVVIITTKRGKANSSNINLDVYTGVQTVARRLNLLNAEEYATINNEARIAAGRSIALEKLRDPSALGEGTDWQDLLFRRAKMQNYSLSASGGSEKARFAISGTYFQQDGIIVGTNFDRFTLRANGDMQANRILKVGTSIALTHLRDRQINNSDNYNAVSQLLRIPPTVQAYRPDGFFYQPNNANDNFTEENPLATALRNNNRFTRNRAITSFYAELEPLKGLRFRTNVGADLQFDNGSGFSPRGPELEGFTQRYITASAYAFRNDLTSYLITNTASYDRLFADKHQVALLVGQEAQQFDFSNVSANRSNYTRNDLQTINSGPINALTTNGGTIDTPRRLASYFSRLNYEFAGKYIFQATARYDGSSRFQPGEKFGFFPGASIGWRISEEDFLKGNNIINNLKLRAGYGKVGNELNAGRFAYLSSVDFGINYPLGPDGALNPGAAPTRLRNTDLRWETNNQANIGLDFGFLNNRFEASIDVYSRKSPNLIAPIPQSLVSGTFRPVDANAAAVTNKGLEVSLTSNNFQGTGGALSWTTLVNFSATTSNLESLGAGLPYNGTDGLGIGAIVRYDVGQPLGSFFGQTVEGIIQTQAEVDALNEQAKAGSAGAKFYQNSGTAPGDFKFRDTNGDGTITDADRSFIGNPNPDFTYGITNTLGFKGFDLSFFIQGVQGNDVYNLGRLITDAPLVGSTTNGTTRVLGRWTGPGTSTTIPRATVNDPNNNLRGSTYLIEDGSYARLKNLTLGYTLPRSILNRVSASQLRFYVSAQNLFTLTKYTGFDPEVSASGVDRGIYPQARTFIGGINFGFLAFLSLIPNIMTFSKLKLTTGAFLLSLGLLVGCTEKFLEEAPAEGITDANFYQTENDALQAVIAAYSELTKEGQYNMSHWAFDMWSDVSSTGADNGNDGREYKDLEAFTIPTTNPVATRLWGGSFVGIQRANIVIQKVPLITNINPAIQQRSIGEAQFLRAKYYFDLVRAYGDVPLFTTPPSSPAEVTIARTPAAQVYTQIEKDLADAFTNLPASYEGADKGRATKWAAAGLLAKVYITQGKKTEAAKWARDVINGSGKTMYARYADNFGLNFIGANGMPSKENNNAGEALFEIQYVNGRNEYDRNNVGSAMNEFFGPRGANQTPGSGYGFNIPDPDFVEGYEPGDTRRAASVIEPGFVYPDGAKQAASATGSNRGFNVKKWFIGKDRTYTNIWDSPQNVPVLRLAEMYLILAEAVGPTSEGLEAINKVRRRAFGLDINTPSPARDLTAATPNFTNAVLRERKYELAFEFDRWFDMKRAQLLYPNLTDHALIPRLTAQAAQLRGYESSPHGIPTVNNLVLPIPQDEITTNPGLTQNPGY